MEPKYKHGDMLLVHPSRPYKAGDYVVVIMSSSDATHEVMVKRFISQNNDHAVLEQLNPKKRIKVSHEQLGANGINLIVGSYEAR